MKDAIKAVIRKGEKTFFKEGELTLYFSGDHHEALKGFFRARGLVPGSPVVVKFQDKESKTWEQIKTIYLLFSIYDRFLHANIEGYADHKYKKLKRNMKEKYGVLEEFERVDGSTGIEFLSLSEYKKEQAVPMISGMMEEMIKVFAEYNWEDKRFESMVRDFNSQPVEQDKEIEIY